MDPHILVPQNKWILLVVKMKIIFVMGIFFAACSIQQEVFKLPTPEFACPTNIDWYGIVPGKSTYVDVIRIMGKPVNQGYKKFGNVNEFFITYPINKGSVTNYIQDKIFFRSDKIVDWIEAVVADRDGSFHPLLEITNEIGVKPDIGYFNNNYDPSNLNQHDVLGGPDQIDVWSECGLAVDLLPSCFMSDANTIQCDSANPNIEGPIVFQYPSPYNVGPSISQNDKNVILMKFIFQPTSYEGFKNYYMYKIPFGLWDAYVKEISH